MRCLYTVKPSVEPARRGMQSRPLFSIQWHFVPSTLQSWACSSLLFTGRQVGKERDKEEEKSAQEQPEQPRDGAADGIGLWRGLGGQHLGLPDAA